jgi:hypothetical protein
LQPFLTDWRYAFAYCVGLAFNQIKLDDYSQVISSLSSKLSVLPIASNADPSLKLYKQKGAPEVNAVSGHRYPKFRILRKGICLLQNMLWNELKKTLSEDGQTVVGNEDSPSINVYTTIAELDPGTTDMWTKC